MASAQQFVVEGVALNRFAAGFADGFDHFGAGLDLRGGSAGHVENIFLENGAVKVVGAVTQSDLGEFGAEADPVGSDVIEIVEVKAADGDGAK